ncbi:MAG: AAA family ATPase [Patescibacteria group bacterium]|nr:AAA family ATPase [Patescibacteria group bacterium]
MLERTLVVVNGLPATGKTTLARVVADILGLPLFIEDDYKEAIFDKIGVQDREWSKTVGSAAIRIHFRVIEACLRAGVSCMIENFFRREIFSDRITKLCFQHGFSCVQVLCYADGEEVYRRFSNRALSGERHPGHDDANCLERFRPSLLQWRLDPLILPGRLIEVDTTEFSKVDFAAIAEDIRRR